MSNRMGTAKQEIRPTSSPLGISLQLAGIGLATYWLILFTLTHLPRLPRAIPRVDDKLAHFGAYFVLTLLMCHTTRSANNRRRFTVIGIVAMTYGAIDESTQLCVPNRHADVWDFACDVVGIWFAIAIYLTAKRASERFAGAPLGGDGYAREAKAARSIIRG